MLIYIILVENGEYERDKDVFWAGIDLTEALKALDTAQASYQVHFEIWQGDKCLTSYYRDAWIEKDIEPIQMYGKWERNSGTPFPPLEASKG